MNNPLLRIDRQYWYAPEWLAIPEGVQRPTCFHILHIDSSIIDERVIKTAREELYDRLQILSKKEPSKQRIADALMRALSESRRVLSDPTKREAYVVDLRDQFARQVSEFVQSREIRSRADLTEEIRRHLERTIGGAYGFARQDASKIVESVVVEYARGKRGRGDAYWLTGPDFPDDPSYPNYFDLLCVSEAFPDSVLLKQIDDNYQRISRELEAKQLTSNTDKAKFNSLQIQLREAREKLTRPGDRVLYVRQLLDLRKADLESEIGHRLLPDESEVSRPTYVALLDYGHRIRLSDCEIDNIFRKRRLVVTGGEFSMPGRLGPLPIVDLGEFSSTGISPFAFELSNHGQQRIRVQLRPQSSAVKLDSVEIEVPPQGRIPVSGKLDRGSFCSGRQRVLIHVDGPGGGDIWVYLTMKATGAQLQVLGETHLGSMTVGQLSKGNLKIANSGDEDLHCEIKSDSGWLSPGISRVTVLPGRAETVVLNIDLRNQPVGLHSALIRILSNGGNGSARVTVEAREPVPGKLSVISETQDLGYVFFDENRTFEVIVENCGDTALTVTLSSPPEPTSVKLDVGEIILTPREQKTVPMMVSPRANLLPRSTTCERIMFHPQQGQSPLSATVTYRVAAKPTIIDCSGLAFATIGSIVLLPAIACQALRDIKSLQLLFSLISWSITPVGISMFRRVWSDNALPVQAIAKASGLQGAMWILMPAATKIVSAVISPILGILIWDQIVLKTLVSSIIGAGIGLVWLECFIFSGMLQEQLRCRFVPWFTGGFAAGLIPVLLGFGTRDFSPSYFSGSTGTLGEFCSLLLITGLLAILFSHQSFNVPARYGRIQLRILWTAAVPFMVCFIAMGIVFSVAPDSLSPFENLDFWRVAAWFQFVRLH